MKILLYNMAYGTGLNGSWKQYFLKTKRYFWLPLFHSKKIAQLLKKQRADVLCLIEVDGGAWRNRFCSQVKSIAKKINFNFYHSKSKYHPKSIWNLIPFVRKRHDAIIANKKGDVFFHYLNKGMKKLIQEFVVDNISIFTAHLAVLSEKVRKKQFEELAKIVMACSRPFVLCGDFNIQKGLKEVKEFAEITGLQLVKLPATWPSCNPKKHFDLFFTSPGVKIKDAGIIKSEYSDHLPVWVEIDR